MARTLTRRDAGLKRDQGKRHKGCCPRGGEKQREKRRLRVVMMVMMMMVVMMGPSSERRTCKHHQEQRCCKQFLHKTNPSTQRFADESARPRYVSKK
jgi:hypothetical protein